MDNSKRIEIIHPSRFQKTLELIIRGCRKEDLPKLEWFGMFYEHRNIIRKAYEDYLIGNISFLVAEANSFPIGQLWIDLKSGKRENTGTIWAFRVLEPFHRMGIGKRMINKAEEELEEKGFLKAEIRVARDNVQAKRLYEKMGYKLTGEIIEDCCYVNPAGITINYTYDLFRLQKAL